MIGVAVTHVDDVDQGVVGAGQVQLLIGAEFQTAERRTMQLSAF